MPLLHETELSGVIVCVLDSVIVGGHEGVAEGVGVIPGDVLGLGVAVGEAVAVGEGVGGTVAVGEGDGGTVAVGDGGTVAVGVGVAQAPPAIKETSSMT